MNNYEQKYKEALERAKAMIKVADNQDEVIGFANTIFPELAESEDEKIRKLLIEAVTQVLQDQYCSNRGVSKEKVVAWLEKQDDKEKDILEDAILDSNEDGLVAETIRYKNEKQAERKVESKFKIGDWVILTAGELSNTLQIANIDTNKKLYWFNDGSYLPIVDEECLHLWTIQDAKDSDIIATEPIDSYPFPFVAIYKNHGLDFFNSYCFIGFDGKFSGGKNGHSIKNIHPATKEQRDLLFQKIKEAGYEWNSEKKELKKIIDENQIKKNLQDNSFRRMFEQKREWSEEDSIRLQRIIDFLWYNRKGDTDTIYQQEQDIDWLKSLKDLNKCSYTFNEIDKEILNAAILFAMNSTDEFACNGVSKEDVIDLLKSIIQRIEK